MIMNNVLVRLCHSRDHTQTYDLRYRLLDNAFVPKWRERYLYSQSRGDDISTRDQFYGLHSEESAEQTIKNINQNIDQINEFVPDLIKRKITHTDDQKTLNYLHDTFSKYHGKIDSWLTHPWWKDKPREMFPLWSDLKNNIHRLKHYRHGGSNPRIKICWYNTPKTEKLCLEDYALYEPGCRFGMMYSMYSDVGKDLLDLAQDDDDPQGFVPPTYYSSDFHLRFHTEGDDVVKHHREISHKYHQRNKNYFESKGFGEDDHRLVIGSIPIASLVTKFSESKILQDLSRFDRIQGVYLY